MFTVIIQYAVATNQCHATNVLIHSLTAALDQLRVVASSTSNDPGPRSRQHQQIGQCLLPIAAANFSVDEHSLQGYIEYTVIKSWALFRLSVTLANSFTVADRN